MPFKSKSRPISLKQNLASLPIIGYVLKLGWYLLTLPKLQKSFSVSERANKEEQIKLRQEVNDISITNKSNNAQLEDLGTRLQDSTKSQLLISDRLADINHQLQLLSRQTQGVSINNSIASKSPGELLANDHSLDQFYIDFENKFRGSEEEIQERLKEYLPYFKKLNIDFEKYPVLDIGCGRGELLKVLGDNGVSCIGLDINESMVKRATKLGYKAIQADAMEYLSSKKSHSFSAITGFHIAEHIPFSTLIRLFEECYRVLKPGGIVIFETPNPESLHVGSYSFYFDPSHLNPLPPVMLSFTLENRGFNKVDILRLHPKRDDYMPEEVKHDEFTEELLGRFFGPQDYAVIGYKSKG